MQFSQIFCAFLADVYSYFYKPRVFKHLYIFQGKRQRITAKKVIEKNYSFL